MRRAKDWWCSLCSAQVPRQHRAPLTTRLCTRSPCAPLPRRVCAARRSENVTLANAWLVASLGNRHQDMHVFQACSIAIKTCMCFKLAHQDMHVCWATAVKRTRSHRCLYTAGAHHFCILHSVLLCPFSVGQRWPLVPRVSVKRLTVPNEKRSTCATLRHHLALMVDVVFACTCTRSLCCSRTHGGWRETRADSRRLGKAPSCRGITDGCRTPLTQNVTRCSIYQRTHTSREWW